MVQGQWVAAFGQGALVLLALAVPANAQVASCQTAEISQNLPPADSPPLVRCYELVFEPAGAQRLTTETYLYSIGAALQPSLRSANKWVPYQERDVLTAFERLWKTRFLDDLWVEVVDEPYENSVIGKHVIFHLEERVRVTTIEYAGSKDVSIAEIERVLRDKGLVRPGGGFVDESLPYKIREVLKELYAQKGYPNAIIAIKKEIVPSVPRLARVTFEINKN